jgi:hypothetical protein
MHDNDDERGCHKARADPPDSPHQPAELPIAASPPGLGDTLLLGGGIAAAILFHPVIGALTALTIVIVKCSTSRRASSSGALSPWASSRG